MREQLSDQNQTIWLKIQLLKVLMEGRVKPDNPSNQKQDSREDTLFGNKLCNSTGIIRDSKEFIPLINGLCKSIEKDLDIQTYAKAME